VRAVNASVHLLGRVLPAIVHIKATIAPEHPSARLLGAERMGSGTVIDPSGLILTVNYVVLGANEVTVTLLDQQEYTGHVVKHDFRSGLGLVRIATTGLPALGLRPSSEVKLGDDVFLVASIGGGQARLSTGNVSYLGPFDANWEYVVDRGIMTTAMNPGLGGGPLLNSLGHVLGVVSLNLNEIGRFSFVIPSTTSSRRRRRSSAAAAPAWAGGRGSASSATRSTTTWWWRACCRADRATRRASAPATSSSASMIARCRIARRSIAT
jgi:S1-C subfamily serine protease